MIERYSRPAMKQVWSDENKYRKWLEETNQVMQNGRHDGDAPASDEPVVAPAPEQESNKSEDKTEKPEEKAAGNN